MSKERSEIYLEAAKFIESKNNEYYCSCNVISWKCGRNKDVGTNYKLLFELDSGSLDSDNVITIWNLPKQERIDLRVMMLYLAAAIEEAGDMEAVLAEPVRGKEIKIKVPLDWMPRLPL